jgi:hypothetical protein
MTRQSLGSVNHVTAQSNPCQETAEEAQCSLAVWNRSATDLVTVPIHSAKLRLSLVHMATYGPAV